MTNQLDHLAKIMKERKSVRKFDTNVTISQQEITEMLTLATEAPSSSNLQPWRFLVIQDQETKKKVRHLAFNQEQVETASAIFAVIGDTEMYHNIDKIYRANFEAGYIDEVNLGRMTDNAKALYPNAPKEVRKNIATFDGGLISMQLMLIAKAKGYDTVCMGGFDKKHFAEAFDLSDRYEPLVLIALGKPAAPAYGSTRLPLEEITTFI